MRGLADVGLEATEEAEAFDRTVRDRLAKRGRPEDRQLVAALKHAADIPVPTNAASHVATTLFRAMMATALVELAAEYDDPITQSTAVPAKYAFDPHEIVNHDLGRFTVTMRKRVERCLAGTPVVAAVDFSLNQHASEACPTHWQPHLNLWVFDKSPEEVTEALGACPRFDVVGKHWGDGEWSCRDFGGLAHGWLPSGAWRGERHDWSRRLMALGRRRAWPGCGRCRSSPIRM